MKTLFDVFVLAAIPLDVQLFYPITGEKFPPQETGKSASHEPRR